MASMDPLPPHYSRHYDEHGLAYYANDVAKTTSWLHPGKLRALQDAGIVPSGARGTPDAPAAFVPGDSSAKAEDEYTSKGVLPPWVLEETTVPPPGSGLEPRPYWVNYRTDRKNSLASPLDRYRAQARAAKAQAQTTRL